VRSGALPVDAVLTVLDDSGLRGLGGAGFPAGRKWRAVRGEPGPRLMAVNADEGEPGTFKDRHYLYTDPHRFLEGTLIAAHVVEADGCLYLLRDEYPVSREILRARDRKAAARTALHPPEARGRGLYMREESALLGRIKASAAIRATRPPYPFQVGLFGQPTADQQWRERVLGARPLGERRGLVWKSFGRNERTGCPLLRIGRVTEPGVKLAPSGITVRQLIGRVLRRHGRRPPAHRLSCPAAPPAVILPASMDDIPLDFGTLRTTAASSARRGSSAGWTTQGGGA
jgi:formate dehydrogenase